MKQRNADNALFILPYREFSLSLQSIMKEVIVLDADLRRAAAEGMDEFLAVFVTAIKTAIGGELTQDNISELNAQQVTLLAYDILHQEVMDGGFVQLIHNGYGPFIFLNPFAKAIKLWGMKPLAKLIYEAHTLYNRYGKDIEKDCTDEEFMALFEQYPDFDDLDDTFIEYEEEWTEDVARYVDDHIEQFASIKE